MNTVPPISILEAALLCAEEPLPQQALEKLFVAENISRSDLEQMLQTLQAQWQGRGLELVLLSSGWRFQSRPQIQRSALLAAPEPVKPATLLARRAGNLGHYCVAPAGYAWRH